MIRMRFTTFPLVTKISPTSSSSAASPCRMSARLRAFWFVYNGEGMVAGEGGEVLREGGNEPTVLR